MAGLSLLTRRNFLGTLAPWGRRPNLLLILADDLGYSDLGCFGGEIETPNLDRLASRGVRLTQFYNSARCCPSRASLLTGLYPHQAGVGDMTNNSGQPRPGFPGYQTRLNDDCPTAAEILKQAGYATLMSGKWHLGPPGPDKRGFDEYYGLVGGFDSFWNPAVYRRLPEGRPARRYPQGQFYATDAITDHALDFLHGARLERKPWFLYLSYTAPHFPLHAPKALIDKYAPVYEQGWDRIRQQRLARQKQLDIVSPSTELTPRSWIPANRYNRQTGWADKFNPPWDEIPLNRRKDLARRMAVFAAMVEAMDRNIGRVLDDLKAKGELNNTLVLFFSDNGACAEWDPWGFDIRTGPDNILHEGARLEEMGQPGTYHSTGSGWANASNTPWRLYKHYTHEGGITTPFIAHWPDRITARGAIRHTPAHLIDVLPTFLSAAGARAGKMEGVNLLPLLSGGSLPPRTLFFEHEGNRAVRAGKWKLAALGPAGPWELYDMERDRTELKDLAAAHPEIVRQLSLEWEAWARRTNVIPWIWEPAYQSAR